MDNDHSDIGFVPDSSNTQSQTQDHSDIGFQPDISLSQKASDALEGFGNVMSAGTLPALQAGAAQLINAQDPNKDLDDQLREGGTTIVQPDWNDVGADYASYQKLRDDAKTRDPEAYYAGELAGAVPTAASGLIGTAKAAAPLAGGLLKSPITKEVLKYIGVPAAAYSIGKHVGGLVSE